MPTFLKRYLAGDCAAVWRELIGFGEDVRQKRYYADAAPSVGRPLAQVQSEECEHDRHHMNYGFGRVRQNRRRFGEPPGRNLPHQHQQPEPER